MSKKLISLLIAGAFASYAGMAAAACADSDLTPDLFQSIGTNDGLGSLTAKYPCGLPEPSSYKDAIGREFKVYTWSTLNKTMTIQTYENRVFNKSSSNLQFQSTKAAPADAAYNAATQVLSLPVLTVTDSDGNRATYYDAKVSLSDNGNWTILSMDDAQKGDTLYDTRAYTPANYNTATGKLTVPNLKTESGTTPFAATLSANGTWADSSATPGAVPLEQKQVVVPADASYNSASRVLNLPVLRLADGEGNVATYYDAKISITPEGKWAILSMNTEHAGNEVYDTSTYAPASLDMGTGLLTVANLDNGDGTSSNFQASLAANGTWSPVTQNDQIALTTKAAVAPANPSYDTATKVMTLPVVSVTASDGSTKTYYDAKISLTANGGWSILGMDESKQGGTAYDVSNYTAAKLDLKNGVLVVPALSDGAEGTLAFRATLNANGTWADASDGTAQGFITNTSAVARVATGTTASTWAGLGENGVVTVGTVAYRNTEAGCELPPGAAGLTVYRKEGSLYLASDTAPNTCSVEALGSAN